MIKNLSTLLLLVLLPAMLLAQSRNVEFHKKTVDATGEEVVLKAVNPDKYSVVDDLMWVDGTVVGFTYYDYMTNGALGQRIISFDDNTLMVGTMAAEDPSESVALRGTYYNYYNGTTWLDTAVVWNRLETARTGWGNIDAFPTEKFAVVVSHVALYLNLNAGSPEAPTWIQSVIPGTAGLTWPKHAVAEAGDNANIYVIGGSSAGLPAPFFRSTDAGTTWEPQKNLIDTLSDLYPDYRGMGADDYMVDAVGNKVAVISATTQGDVLVFISDDQGVNFTETLVHDGAKIDSTLGDIPFDSSFFPAADYKMLGIPYPDGTCDLLIDANDVVHVAFGTYELGYYINTDTLGNAVRGSNGELQRTFFITDYNPGTGIYYWNSNMTGVVRAVQPTAEMVGESLWSRTRGGAGFFPVSYQAGLDVAMTGMPQLSYGDNGNVYMVFTGFKEGDRALLDSADPESWSLFAHVYAVASSDGNSWTSPVDLYGDITGEDVNFPALTDRANGDLLHLLVQNDQSPGTWLQQAAHPFNKNAFIYKSFPVPAVDVNDEPGVISSFELQQNYPNPFNPATIINYSLPSRSSVSLKVYDVLGREVKSLVNATQEAGSYTVSFNGTGLASGLYVYTLEAGSFKVSKKMMLMK
jgi:hypothetical protein